MEDRVDFTGLDRGRSHDITIEEVKACDIFAGISDEAAQEVIDTLKKLSLIMFDYYQKEQESLGKKG